MNFCLPFVAAGALFASAAIAQDKPPVNAGPYVPTLSGLVADMLSLAEVGRNDFVIDLGSGDGRIVITAAKLYGARGFGVDINEKLVKEANESARQQGLADRASFRVQDLFKTDISKATVLTMYLLPNTVNMLKDKLLTELRPGTRIVSHDYALSEWSPAKTITMDLEEKVAVTGVPTTHLFLYRVPAKFSGKWSLSLPDSIAKKPIPLNLEPFLVTRIRGSARYGGKDIYFHEARMEGEQILFKLTIDGTEISFTGLVRADSMEGTLDSKQLKSLPWKATRIN